MLPHARWVHHIAGLVGLFPFLCKHGGLERSDLIAVGFNTLLFHPLGNFPEDLVVSPLIMFLSMLEAVPHCLQDGSFFLPHIFRLLGVGITLKIMLTSSQIYLQKGKNGCLYLCKCSQLSVLFF